MQKPLPTHLQGMTQAKWDAIPKAQRESIRDNSELHPQLREYVGKRVKVSPKREYGASTFRVGITTGWRPALLAMRGNARGSSDLIGADEIFTSIKIVG